MTRNYVRIYFPPLEPDFFELRGLDNDKQARDVFDYLKSKGVRCELIIVSQSVEKST